MTGSAALQIEALLLASPAPVSADRLAQHFGRDVSAEIASVTAFWANRGMQVRLREGAYSLVPSEAVLKALSRSDARKGRKLSDAAVETLCYAALHQPVTVKEIEKARGVALFKGLVDSLLDAGFVRAALRKTDSGRAVTYVTTDAFLDHFGLSSLADLPSRDELLEMLADTPGGPDPEEVQTENEEPQPQVDTAFGLDTSNLSDASDEM